MATYSDLYELLIEHILVSKKKFLMIGTHIESELWMSSYLDYQQSIIYAGVLEAAKQIG